MSIVKDLKEQVLSIIQKNSTENNINLSEISTQLLNISTKLEPTSIFPHLNQVQLKQPQIVFVSLTVQDILDTQYYYAYLISKPVNKNSQIHVLKYGHSDQKFQNIKLQEYQTIMDSRQTLICLTDFYNSKWIEQQWKGPSNIDKPISLKVSGKHEFKLGQRIHAVCVWDPFDKNLIFVRLASKQQIQKQKLSFQLSSIKQNINFKEARQMMVESLNKFCTKPQSIMVLLSMISDQPMFVNGQNIKKQLQNILPRVSEIKIKAPFKQSLFPYKNSDGLLIRTPMQMSLNKTFVIIDFSQFSNQKQIKIDQAEIDNLKALKMFVEEGKTIYRWQYGESLIDHIHSGIIVKGSKIVTPNFHLSQTLVQKQNEKNNPYLTMDPEIKHKLRIYLQKCLLVKPSLSQQSKKKIQLQLKQKMQKNPDKKLMIEELMMLARLNAKSYGRQVIQFQDYTFAKDLLNES